MLAVCFASLLHPIGSALVIESPAPDSSGRAENGQGSRTVQVARTGQVNDSAIEVAQVILGGSVRIKNQAIGAHQRAVIYGDGGGTGAEAVRTRVREIRLAPRTECR